MDLLKVTILSFSSLIILFILTKIMGNRSMSQISMFDYIASISIGSIASHMATDLTENYLIPLIAMSVYSLSTVLIAFLTSKSLTIRRILSTESLILLDNGNLYVKNFKKSKLDINEFLMQCRDNGYFNINDIQTAILEHNRKNKFYT